MAGLQRFITYVYKYENDEKGANTGFAKTEIRGSACRVEIHIRNANIEQSECTIYLFVRRENMIQGIPVGNIMLSRGNGDVRYVFERKELLNFGVSESQLEGLYIPIDNRDYFASQWKEGEIRQERFQVLEKKEQQENDVLRERIEEQTATTGPSDTKKQMEVSPQNDASLKQDVSPQNDASLKQEVNPQNTASFKQDVNQQGGKESFTDFLEAASKEEENIQATEIPMEQFFEQSGWEGVFQKLRLKLTVFYPFEGENIECIRMELKDIRELPKKYWYLGNNSFLLHGFFNYRHIVLGEIGQNEKKEYFLGVPGVFQNQERIMATMFGFPEFRTAQRTAQKTGNYGYWYRII